MFLIIEKGAGKHNRPSEKVGKMFLISEKRVVKIMYEQERGGEKCY